MPLITSDLEFSDDYPTIEPSLRLDFANARALDPRITFTRASTATYVGRDGLIKTAGEDEARFDHDPATGESLGLLIEESRTNLVTHSEDLSNAAWSKNNSSIQSNSIVSPSGDTTADKIYDDTTSGTQHYTTQSFSKEATTYTGSVYVKAAEYTKLAVGFTGVANWQGIPQAQFDLVSEEAALLGADTTATINSVGNGWYRVSITSTSLNTTASALTLSHVSDSGTNTGGGNIFLGHDGDGVSGLYIWGAQIEAGSFPTSYIPTSGSTATRALEYGYTTNMDFYNQNEGSIFSEVSLLDVGNTSGKAIWSFNVVGGFGEGIYMVNENGGTGINHVLYDNSVSQYSRAVVGSISANQFYKTIYSQQTNNVNSAGDGSVGTDDTSATLPTIGRLVIGNNAWGSSPLTNGLNPSNCHMKSFSYYPKRLTNAQLQTLTQ
jgi:hypothetical protein